MTIRITQAPWRPGEVKTGGIVPPGFIGVEGMLKVPRIKRTRFGTPHRFHDLNDRTG